MSGLLSGFVFGTLGIYVFKQAKANGQFIRLFIAIAMMVYPYFVQNDWLVWVIGGGLFWLSFQAQNWD
jgi:hypothetical protein